MESKGKLVLVAVVGVIVAFGAISIYKKMAATDKGALVEKNEPSNRVLVAARDLSAGSFVNAAADINWFEVERESITADHIREGTTSINSFDGAIVRRSLRAGDRVSPEMLMKSGEGGFLSAVLEEGKRAISVSVNATSGNAGFISPGDRVDMIVTRRLRLAGEGSGEDQIISETFLRNIRVLAVDQSVDNPENKAILAKTVTLEVTTEEAEQIAIATELGKISLALRSMAGAVKEQAEKEAAATSDIKPEAGTDLMNMYGGTKKEPRLRDASSTSRIRVIRGDQVENLEMQ